MNNKFLKIMFSKGVSLKKHFPLTNALLLLILLTIIYCFYITSPVFKSKIDRLGYSSKSEIVGVSSFSCIYGKLTKEDYENKLKEINEKIKREELKNKLINMDLYSLKSELSNLKREGFLTQNIESVRVTRLTTYRFGIKTQEIYKYIGEEPKNGLNKKCNCEGSIKNGLCEWKTI